MSHPLFPPTDDDDGELDVGFIHVIRDGQWCPRTFAADELTDLADVYEQFGGGRYELVARGPDKRHIIARRSYRLGGAPKPLDGGPPAPEGAAIAQPPAPVQSADSGLLSTLLPMLMQMMQQSTQIMLKSSEQQNAMLMAVLQQGTNGSNQHVATMQALHDRHSREMTQLMSTMMQSQTRSDGGSADAMVRGFELARQMMAKHIEGLTSSEDDDDEDPGDLMNTINQFLSGMNFAQNGPPPAVGPQAPPSTQSHAPPPPVAEDGDEDDELDPEEARARVDRELAR